MDGYSLAIILAASAMLYAIYRAWRRFARKETTLDINVKRWLLSIGLFCVIYTLMVIGTLVLFVFLGVNFTLVSSFLSAPLWIIYILIAKEVSRSLARVFEPA